MPDNKDPKNNSVSLTEHEIKEELKRLFLGGDDWSKETFVGYFFKRRKFYYKHYYAVLSGKKESP